MGIDLGKLFSDAAKGVSDAAKGVSDFVVKTTDDIAKAIDQNGDGKLDISDIHAYQARVQATQEENQRKTDLEH